MERSLRAQTGSEPEGLNQPSHLISEDSKEPSVKFPELVGPNMHLVDFNLYLFIIL